MSNALAMRVIAARLAPTSVATARQVRYLCHFTDKRMPAHRRAQNIRLLPRNNPTEQALFIKVNVSWSVSALHIHRCRIEIMGRRKHLTTLP